MDKMRHSSHSTGTNQVSLYSHSPDSVLYQEMLSYKASATNHHTHSRDNSSDWEVLSGDNYDGDSEPSSLSYFSDGAEDEEDLTPVASNAKVGGGELQRNGLVGVAGLHDEEVEVDYYTPKRFSRAFEEADTGAEKPHQATITEEGVFDSSVHVSPRVSIVQQVKKLLSSSSEGSSSCHTDEGREEEEDRLFLTPGGTGRDSCSSASDVETSFRQRQSRAPVFERETSGAAVTRSNTFQDHTPTGPTMRRTSLAVRGEKSVGGGANLGSVNVANSQYVEVLPTPSLPLPTP